jgi:STE24 endopeptidase
MRIDRRAAWITTAVSLVVFVALAAVLVPWDWVPGGSLQPAAARDVFSGEEIERAEAFSNPQRYLGWASYAVSLLLTGVLGFTSLGARLVRRVVGERRVWLAVPVAVLFLLVLGRLVTLPFVVVSRQRRLDYALTDQAWSAWLVDYGKSLAVSWLLTSLVLLVLIGLMRWSPRRWFLSAGGASAGLVFAGSFLYPVLLEPVFNEFTPLKDGPLRSAVVQLAADEGVEIDGVLVADASRRTNTLNAYVSGFGNTRRVVLYDNLVRELPVDEASVIVAHELAHAKHDDVLIGTSLGAAGAVLGVSLLALVLDSPRVRRRAGVSGPVDATGVPLILALAAVATLLVSPVQGSISRAIEVRADRTSLEATGESDTFVAMQRELALSSLSDPTPPAWSQFWFGSHPTTLQRVGLPASLEAAR